MTALWTRRVLRVLIVVLLCLEAGCLAGPARADPDHELPRGQWPLHPRPDVVRRFDPPDTVYGAGHRGVDLLGRPGQRVRTALAGTVSFAGMLAGKGVVSVRHEGGLRTTYEPVTATVHVGDVVTAGTAIGVLRVGPSHCRPAHCLHWGLIRGETYLDPLLLVGGGPVRLLPLAGRPLVVNAPVSAGAPPAPSVPTVTAADAALAGQSASTAR
ncbi:murein hydrolase activator EnvC family protein [Marmoricola endophyticus]|uniref:murein hydrolase activator EnvC family protein n=1 Tax=Marmoricola endophyticus TaxID=2040280 RepID=UPI001E344CD9|nr:M23 family metallopeptidase [Marmoricola endophyticus]